MQSQPTRTSMRVSSLLLLILLGMVIQSALGLAFNPYRDVDWIALGWLGNDGVTLCLVCPLFAAALSGPRLGAPRWQVIRLGLLGYAVYNYAFYMLGAALNEMFPLYVALFAAAVAALVSEMSADRVRSIAASYSSRTPVRLLGGYLAGVAVCLSAVWLGMWALHVFAGRPAPGSPEVFRLVAALDLGFMVPALSIGGVLLWRRKPLGYVLGSIAGIQAALYLFVLSVNSALGIHQGLARWPGELPIWAPLCAATTACALMLVRHVPSWRAASRVNANVRPRGRTLMPIIVRPDDLSSPEVRALIAEHLAGMRGSSPPGHVHALAIDGLRQADVSFWCAWRDSVLCGCGALKQLDATSGEIKSMRTRPAFLRQGVGQAILDEILRTAASRGYDCLYLETGTGAPFAAAHALYLRNGFNWCGPFGDYQATDFNVFMVKRLRSA